MFKITRVSADDFETERDSTIVDTVRNRDRKAMGSFVSQLQGILNGEARYATVKDAVNDMLERTGLNKFEQLKSKLEVLASVNDAISSGYPKSLLKYDPALKDYLEKLINAKIEYLGVHGVSIPQLQHDIAGSLKVNFQVEPEDINNKEFEDYLKNIIEEAKKLLPPKNPSVSSGGMDGSDVAAAHQDNQDVFKVLEPHQ